MVNPYGVAAKELTGHLPPFISGLVSVTVKSVSHTSNWSRGTITTFQGISKVYDGETRYELEGARWNQLSHYYSVEKAASSVPSWKAAAEQSEKQGYRTWDWALIEH